MIAPYLDITFPPLRFQMIQGFSNVLLSLHLSRKKANYSTIMGEKNNNFNVH